MIKNGKNTSCYGCGVCSTSCPKNAIKIELSDEGFWVPIVDLNKCIDCGICDKVCAYNDADYCTPKDRRVFPLAYAIVHKDKNIREESTSGGAGYAIAQYLHQLGYKLVGVRYDVNKNIAVHFVTDSIEEFKQTLNSKYIPSYTVNGFAELMDGNKYAVFGTPCQIDSLRRWARLRKKEDNFIFIDLFCHGVPSYLHWNAYLSHHLETGEYLKRPTFRDKTNGWHAYTMSLETNKRFISTRLQNNDYFQNIFFGNYTLNRTCYNCVYRGSNSAADIRMGDLWGGKYADNEAGITGVLALTNKGEHIVLGLYEYCQIINEDFKTIMAGQLHKDLTVPQSRQKLINGFKDGKSLPLLYFCHVRKMWLKNLVPYHLKSLIKKIKYKIKGE